MAKNVLGFDIGSYSIKIVKYNGSSIQRAVELAVPENLVKDGCIADYDAMADFIKSVIKKKKLAGNQASVILPTSLAILRRFEMPLMTIEQLELNLPYEFHDFLDLDKDDYFYDYVFNYTIAPPTPAEGEQPEAAKMDITAAAVPKAIVRSYKEMFKRAGLKLVTAIPKECAYSNLLKKSGASNGYECCFIELGLGHTDVDIFKGTVFQSGHSNEISLLNPDEDPEAIFGAISSDIRKSLNFYKFSNRESELEIAYCFGDGFKVPELMNSIHSTTGFTLKSAKELLPPFAEKAEFPGTFALAVGAVLQ